MTMHRTHCNKELQLEFSTLLMFFWLHFSTELIIYHLVFREMIFVMDKLNNHLPFAVIASTASASNIILAMSPSFGVSSLLRFVQLYTSFFFNSLTLFNTFER